MVANSQNYWEIELSKNSKVEHMGVWVNGDYAIYVELDKIKEILLRTSQSSENSALYYYNKDSNLVNYFKSTSNRYKLAIVQLENAKNNFDLRSLIVYDGMEYKNQNVGNSRVIADQIKHLVEMGNAIVFYKGERIYKLKCNSELKEMGGGFFNRFYEIRTYFNDLGNCIFLENNYMGW